MSYDFTILKATSEQQTLIPSATKISYDQLITSITGYYSEEYEVETNSSQIQSLLESTLSLCLQAFFEDVSSKLYEISTQSNIDLTSVKLSIEEGTFSNAEYTLTTKNNVCATLNANSTISHDDTMWTELIR